MIWDKKVLWIQKIHNFINDKIIMNVYLYGGRKLWMMMKYLEKLKKEPKKTGDVIDKGVKKGWAEVKRTWKRRYR